MSKSLVVVVSFTAVVLLLACSVSVITCLYPSQVVDIENWYLTLPIGDVKDPTDIYQPTLATYSIDPYFVVGPNNNSIRFRSVIFNESVTTVGSKYPRSELREMDPINPAKVKISWNNTVGVHTMIIDQAITHLPITRDRVIAGQIHDDNEFIFTITLSGTTLYINAANKATAKVITKTYQLGTIFRLKIEALNGTTNFYYNDMSTPIYTHPLVFKNSYFKAGCYAQSNCTVEGSLCGDSNNYAEVLIYNLTTTHDYSSSPSYVNNSSSSSNGTIINNNNGTINSNSTNNNGTIINNNNGTTPNNNNNGTINNNNGTINSNSTNNSTNNNNGTIINNGTTPDSNNNSTNNNNGTIIDNGGSSNNNSTNTPKASTSNRVVVNMATSSFIPHHSFANILLRFILMPILVSYIVYSLAFHDSSIFPTN
ncbi:predicted protein [Naegleria gruberi]|uniref:Predicted protein n=1 Tax=Naegleria gruberi TaxID=5762 RepID=D2VH95_NAEGR|nr:uncharacterized protein NAEGRDRAFT_68135 [Naegleria gruberi]EFC43761.1 predicted protein [Naegleria gruberi]|eukprot:XP_002676505.1 predicted protein [Naegleria gruberi strain NEG-M]